MSHCKVISVFTIAIALIGWVVLYIVIGQEFLKSIEDGQTSTSANDGHTTIVHPTIETTKDGTQTRTSELTVLVTPHLPLPGCRKGSTKKHVVTPAFTQRIKPSTRKTNGSSEGSANSFLKLTNASLTSSTAIPPQNEFTTQELASNDSGLTSTIDTSASSPPIASPGSNDAGISGNDPLPVQPSDIHKPNGYRVFIDPRVALWRILLIVIEALQ